MEYWSWYAFGLVLALGLIRCIRRDGGGDLLRSMRLWGEGVTPRQRRENLAGLIILLLLALVSVLVWLIP